MEETLLDRDDARLHLGDISDSTLRRLIHEGLPYVRIRKRIIRFRLSDLDRYLFKSLITVRQDSSEGKA